MGHSFYTINLGKLLYHYKTNQFDQLLQLIHLFYFDYNLNFYKLKSVILPLPPPPSPPPLPPSLPPSLPLSSISVSFYLIPTFALPYSLLSAPSFPSRPSPPPPPPPSLPPAHLLSLPLSLSHSIPKPGTNIVRRFPATFCSN